MVPNILHFVFGMAPDFGGKPFSLVHYLAVRSAAACNKPDKIYFHLQYEPDTEWWHRTKEFVTVNRITAPGNFMGRPLMHVAHKADVVRLQMLQTHGGVYMDLDTISVKSLEPLRDCSFGIGEELVPEYVPANARQRFKYSIRKKLGWVDEKKNSSTGLCNAVLLSEPNSPFINKWLEEYSSFRSTGRDKFWNEHSVLVPEKLAKTYPRDITTFSPYAFHYPLYNKPGMEEMFEQVTNFPDAYLHHLWESFSWDKYLSALTEKAILEEDNTYNLIARKYVSS